MDSRFLPLVTELAESLFYPSNILVKKINGRVSKSNELVDAIINYWKILTSEDKAQVKSLVEVRCSFSFMLFYILLSQRNTKIGT